MESQPLWLWDLSLLIFRWERRGASFLAPGPQTPGNAEYHVWVTCSPQDQSLQSSRVWSILIGQFMSDVCICGWEGGALQFYLTLRQNFALKEEKTVQVQSLGNILEPSCCPDYSFYYRRSAQFLIVVLFLHLCVSATILKAGYSPQIIQLV